MPALMINRRTLLGGTAGWALHATLPRDVDAQCEAVEVYPGYPGYRGYITGLDGVGDIACLDDLEALDSNFDRAAEDTANLAAAARLKLTGSPETWTWENWMAIEAERRLVPTTCYACAITAASNRPPPTRAPVQSNDPRLLLGGYGTTAALGP